MASRRRFTVDVSKAGGLSPADAASEIQDANDRIFEDFRKGLITADEAMAEFAAAVRKFGRDAEMTVDERQGAADFAEELLDALAAASGRKGVTKDDVKTDDEAAAETQAKLMRELAEAVEAFRKGLVTADEAARRQAASLDKLGEKAGMTVDDREDERQAGLGDLAAEAESRGEDGPIDPKNPLKGRFGRAFGKMFGKGAVGLGEGLGGLMGSWQPQGGMLGNLLGKNGLVSAIGGGAGAGPIAGPLAVAGAAAQLAAGAFNSVTGGLQKFGDVAAKVARNDGIGALTAVGDGAAEAADKLPVLGQAVGASIRTVNQFVKTFDQVSEAFAARGKEISQFDGDIAGATAESKVIKILGDIREAQELGAEYGQVIREQAIQQSEFQRALTPIKMMLMQQLIPIMKFVNINLKALNALVEGGKRAADEFHKEAMEALKVMAPAAVVTIDLLREGFENAERDAEEKRRKEELKVIEDLLIMGRKATEAEDKWSPDPQQPQPLGIPLFDGMFPN
jgi:hypothetical protein